MGKNKAQRTKNNAKPSNSSRSAELLGTSMPTFVGFSAVKDGGYKPVLPGLSLSALNEVEINAIDSSFQLVLKKMNKKDATTKFKALQEFAELCRDLAAPSVEAVLPFWPRLYGLLCVDTQHRVREAAQVAHAALVKRVGRNIAVYLKQLAGPWFTSQFDTYPPAASTAINSFQDTFPQKKIVEAIVHCQDEILSYISDIIRIQTPQSMSTHKTLTAEELETKYQRVLIASLQAYSSYLKKVPPVQIEKTEKSHEQIISSAKFWKLAKHDSILVKTYFFNALASLIENATELLKDEKKRVMTSIMNSLDETEPSLLLSVWESMLVAITKIDDWHLSVSVDKLVLPKLWRVLKSGGQCCASVVYPNLLPFVSQFPKFNLDHKRLFDNFFTHMRQGFTAKSVQMSRSEMFAVTKSFTECLRYVILLHKSDDEFCEELLKDQLMPVIVLSMTECVALKTVLFCEVTQLVRYWSKNRGHVEYPTYAKLVQIFWRELESTFANLLNRMNETYDDNGNIYEAQIEILCTLKNATTHSRKNLRVKFSDPDDTREEKTHAKSNEIDDDVIFLAELDRFVNNLCVLYLEKNNCRSSDKNVEFLNRIVSNFDSEELFLGIAKAYGNENDLFQFYDEVLKKWLIERTEAVGAIVKLIFSFLRYMNEEKKRSVLTSMSEVSDPAILTSAIICALSEMNRNDPVIRNWCLEPRITERMIDLAKEVGNDDFYEKSDNGENILILAFESSLDRELCISDKAISGIGTILSEHLVKANSPHLPKVVELICRLIEFTWHHKRLTDGSIKMLKSLFELTVGDPLNTADVSYIDTIRNTWKSGFARCNGKLKHDELTRLHGECMNIIHEKMYSSNDSQIEDVLVDYAIDFIEAASNLDASDSVKFAIEFNTREKNFAESWIPQSLELVIYGEVLSGNFYLANPLRSIPLERPVTFVTLRDEILPDHTENCLKWASFNAKLLNKLIGKLYKEDVNDEVNCEVIDCLAELPYMLNYILLTTSIGRIFSNHYKSAKNYETIQTMINSLVTECSILRETVPKNIWNRILTDSLDVDDSWITYGSLFSQFLYLFYGSDQHLLEVDQLGPQILVEYVESESEDDSKLAHDIKAVVTARAILNEEKNIPVCLKVLEKIVKRHQSKSTFFIPDRDVSNMEESQLILPLEIIRLYGKIVRSAPEKLSPGLWDAAIIFLGSWQLTVDKSKAKPEDFKVKALTIAVSDLYYEMQSLFNRHERDSLDFLPSSLLDEWKNLFADDVHLGIARTWISHADLFDKKSEYLMPVIVLDSLGRAMSVIDGNTFFKYQEVAPSSKITSNEIMKLSLKLLPSPSASLQLSAYHVLSRIIPRLVEEDKLLLESETFDCKDLNIRKFEDVLSSTQRVVNAMLMGFKLCDTTSCTIQPHTDSYTYIIGYLLAWANVLDMCSHPYADVRYQYAEFLKDDYCPSLLNNIFRLMPVEKLQDGKTKSWEFTDIFSTPPSLEFRESWTEQRLDHIVCWLFTNSLRHLPVLVRQWWGTTDSRISAAVEKITTLYVSPILCREELLNNRLADIENLQIRVHPNVREVVALYQMDDTKLELSMTLPINHPLGPITVEPGQHAGRATNWRNCHMQLSIFLTHQNGSVWDGLLMWKNNLDKKFSGVEECFICYSIFHINTYQIPKLSCHTCRKKFHAPCLYKWFTTSQKSTCPICRNIF